MRNRRGQDGGAFGTLLGMGMGASILACVVAYVGTFLLTGKLFVPQKEGDSLMSVEEAASFVDQIIAEAREGRYE